MCSCRGCPACQWILEKWRTRSCNETLGRTQAAKLMMRCTPCWTLLRQDEDTQVPIPTPGQSRHRRVCAEVGERDQRLFSIDAGADRFNSFGRKVCFFMGHGPGSASESCPGRFASGLFFRLHFTSIQMHCCRAGLGSAMPSAAPAMLPPRLPQDPGAGPPATAVLSKGEGSGMAG